MYLDPLVPNPAELHVFLCYLVVSRSMDRDCRTWVIVMIGLTDPINVVSAEDQIKTSAIGGCCLGSQKGK